MPRIFLLTLPQNFASGIIGARDLLALEQGFLTTLSGGHPSRSGGFQCQLVGPRVKTATRLGPALETDACLHDSGLADIVYIPPLAILPGQTLGFDPGVLAWLRHQYDGGAMLCSACTGSLLLAATGLLDGMPATTHWAYVEDMRKNFPKVDLQINRMLVVTGDKQQLVTGGGYTSWHDLMLYLIHRFSGAEAARRVARFFLLDWHDIDQQAYMCFREQLQHGDEAIRQAQDWLRRNLSHTSPVDAALERSGLPQRSFLRRFRKSTGLTPVQYLQHLRVEGAKTLLEDTDKSVDQIAWKVGYEDTAYFRRLFRRITGLTPSHYRKTFRMPASVVDLMP